MEFKRLSDVEVVAEPTESANVLIEENGVIKKAPKTAVGGAGGSDTPDMVITVNGSSSAAIVSDTFNITDGSMENVFAAFHEGRYPKVKVRFHLYENDAYTAIREEYNASVCTYGEGLWIKLITVDPYSYDNINCQSIYLDADGFSSSQVSSANLTVIS